MSLQSIFVTQNVRGGEIEHVIPIPYPVTALPRVLPSSVSLVFTGEPATERVHKRGIEPLGERWGHYVVEGRRADRLGPVSSGDQANPATGSDQPRRWQCRDVGFDYGLTPREVGDAYIAGAQVLWERELLFDIEPRLTLVKPQDKRNTETNSDG